jgi:hydrogenase expression/formation protein HypD
MKYLDEFRDGDLAKKIVSAICKKSLKKIQIMEVCGTHTVAIFKYGIKSLIPDNIKLLSGPGCPVCVTPQEDVDFAIEISKQKDVILTTFGDMMKVPGTNSSLEKEKAGGCDIRIVYSVLDAINFAQENPTKKVVFFAVGFETTSPSIAISILEAEKRNLKNYFILPAHKLIPPAMKALVDAKEIKIDGFICPGHVSTIIGSKPYEFISKYYKIPCVISGFEPVDILQGIYMLVMQIEKEECKVEIQYKRSVKKEGNKLALKNLYKVFEECDCKWRGIGLIPNSGLKLKKEFKKYDAKKIFNIKIKEGKETIGCICGEILRGISSPYDCKLFEKKCNPENPIGPCMVSSEGTCSAYYKYGVKNYEK